MKNYFFQKMGAGILFLALMCSAQISNAQCVSPAGGFGGCFAVVEIHDLCGNIHQSVMDLAGTAPFCPAYAPGCAGILQVGVNIAGVFYAAPISWAPGTGPVPCPGSPPGPGQAVTDIHWDSTAGILHIN